jgi:hypothetical protein
MAMGPVTMGRFHAGEPHVLAAAAASSGLSAESEPAKSTCPATNFLMPAPEPDGL